MKPKLILASTSPYRKELLGRLGIPFEAQTPSVDEEPTKAEYRARHPQLDAGLAKGLAAELAALKAQSLARGDAIVIGSDQICFFKGEILGKPGTIEKATETLRRLAGATHFLFTAVSVISNAKKTTWIHEARLKMRALTDGEIAAYVARDNPLDCAGAYKLEQAGISLMDEILSDDWSGIQGLPLITLTKALREHGIGS